MLDGTHRFALFLPLFLHSMSLSAMWTLLPSLESKLRKLLEIDFVRWWFKESTLDAFTFGFLSSVSWSTSRQHCLNSKNPNFKINFFFIRHRQRNAEEIFDKFISQNAFCISNKWLWINWIKSINAEFKCSRTDLDGKVYTEDFWYWETWFLNFYLDFCEHSRIYWILNLWILLFCFWFCEI